jgi:hypothetical protein
VVQEMGRSRIMSRRGPEPLCQPRLRHNLFHLGQNLSCRIRFFLLAYSASAMRPDAASICPTPRALQMFPVHHSERSYFSISWVHKGG